MLLSASAFINNEREVKAVPCGDAAPSVALHVWIEARDSKLLAGHIEGAAKIGERVQDSLVLNLANYFHLVGV